MTSLRALILLALALALLAATPASAQVAGGPCFPGSPATCRFWAGKVTSVADGDTIDVDIDGDGSGPRRVRLIGINATELSRYSRTATRRRGACHAVEATARLEALLRAGRNRVRLAAIDPASMSNTRLRREVSVRLDGRWVDTGAVLVAEGHALWLPDRVEWAWNTTYRVLAQQAAARRVRIWNPSACGTRHAPDVSLTFEINRDAPGNDALNVNGEWIRIGDPSPAPVDLSGWRVGFAGVRTLRFPVGTVLPAGGSVFVHMGVGVNGGADFYWGSGHAMYPNAPQGDGRGRGDGTYLFDPQGNVRGFSLFPA